MTCTHLEFDAKVAINRLTKDAGPMNFMADVTITCRSCGVPMQFMGLPVGCHTAGAATSYDGTEGRFAITPKMATVMDLRADPDPVRGFILRRQT